VVRAVETIADASVESDESAPTCVTLTDTFPPAAPKGLQAVSTEGAINLIWDANTEKDVRGYIVLRGAAAAATLEAIVMEPIQETSFKDGVQPGVRYAYAVQAVDSAGNVSPMSARVEETAR
jgi:fibronectin type 3 domain-containing protein